MRQFDKVTATVRIRRDHAQAVRPNAEQIDGMTFRFLAGWPLWEDPRYRGEFAMVPQDPAWPKDAPHWVASGDVEVLA